MIINMGRKNKNKKRRCGLEKRIQSFHLPKDGYMEFVPYCNYRQHPGIIRDDHYLACRQKQCYHYFEFKLTEFSRKFKLTDDKKQGK